MREAIILNTLSLILLIGGCALPARTVYVNSNFNAQKAERLTRPGPNTIRGRAFVNLPGGEAFSCDGHSVRLIPATRYATERIKYQFRSTRDGFIRSRHLQFEPTYTAYRKNIRETHCNERAEFVFENVADGTFYLIVDMVRFKNRIRQGGILMKQVSVSGGESVDVILSP